MGTAILWSLGTIAVLSGLFAGLILLSRTLPVPRPIRILAVVALWLVVSTLVCWTLFTRSDAEASRIHNRNIGIPIVYFYFWLLAVIASPIVGGAAACLFRWDDDSNPRS
ncbi:MAG TPA: hypothetical protein VN137_11140 [Sphingomonas sp.]|nr:hypothetical protein [Sphingomonas sp.]